MADKTFNVGVVGYGMSAKIFHIPFIKLTPQFKLYSIVQRSPKAGNSAPDDYPDLKHYVDVRALLVDPAVDVIVITTPPDNHFELTKAALEAGKHVLTEKPFVPTVAEAETLIAVAKAQKRLICVYQNRRWDSDFLLVKHLLETDAVGRVVEFESHFDRYRPSASASSSGSWKASLGVKDGGGAVYDLGTHLIDQAYTLFGAPSSVSGRLLNARDGKVDLNCPDSVYAQLFYEDTGLIVHIRISVMSAEAHQPRFWIRGAKGSFHKHALDIQEDQLKAGVEPTDAAFGRDDPANMKLYKASADGASVAEADVPQLEPETYKAFYAAFAKAVATGKEEDVPVKASDARDVLKIIEAVIDSATKGQTVAFSL